MLSVGTVCFEDKFCASKNGEIGGGWWVSAQGAVHMASVLASCRKALVGTGWASSAFVEAPLWTFFSLEKHSLVGESVSLLMSGCGRGHEP